MYRSHGALEAAAGAVLIAEVLKATAADHPCLTQFRSLFGVGTHSRKLFDVMAGLEWVWMVCSSHWEDTHAMERDYQHELFVSLKS